MFWGEVAWNQNKTRPKQSHDSYETFDLAVRDGCYICNTVLVNYLARRKSEVHSIAEDQSESEVAISLEDDFVEIQFGLDLLARIQVNGSMVCLLEFTLVLHSIKLEVAAEFLLEVNKGKTTVESVMAGSTNSERSWTFAKTKLSQCIKHHDCGSAQYQRKDQASWFPTRLLDLGEKTSNITAVKLIETDKILPKGPYVTLSHCWGDASLVTQLLKDNKAAFLAQLPSLPRTFEDAIVATKRLEARYLWIDSLCIIQDDESDWARESMLMAFVYRNALCNIAATAAEDSQGGLFHHRGESLAAMHIDDELLIKYSEPNEYSDTGAQIPLNNQLKDRGKLLKAWADILGRYSTSQLTYKSDFLPAIMGIAEHLQELTGITYLAGMFKPEENFEAHLAWKCVSPQTARHPSPRAPSWSWASIDGPVDLDPFETANPKWIESDLINLRSKVKILDAQVTPSPTEPLKKCSGTLLVEGLVTKATFHSGTKELELDGKPVAMDLFFDELVNEERELFILPLLVIPAFNPDLELGTDQYIHLYLILAGTEEGDDTYARVGLGRFESELNEWNEDPTMTGIFMRTEDKNPWWQPCEEHIGLQPRLRICII